MIYDMPSVSNRISDRGTKMCNEGNSILNEVVTVGLLQLTTHRTAETEAWFTLGWTWIDSCQISTRKGGAVF